MVAKPLCPLYKNIIKPLDRARYPELRYTMNGIYWKGIKQRIGRFYEKVHECILIFTDWLG